jgi:hypothetical protein
MRPFNYKEIAVKAIGIVSGLTIYLREKKKNITVVVEIKKPE